MKEKLEIILNYIQQAKNYLEILDESKYNNSTFIKTGTLDLLKYAIRDMEAAIKEDEEEPTERFEVRKRLLEILGFPTSEDLKNNFEKVFDWVMDGKKVDRDGKLFCLKYGKEHSCGNIMYTLTVAKEIFDVLL